MAPRAAHVKLKLNGMGMGTVVINGVDMSKHVHNTRVVAHPGEKTAVILQINVETLDAEIEGVERLILEEYRDYPVVRQHDFNDADVCRVCRQVRRVAAATCPGPLIGASTKQT
jgi:hypothetical protein